MTTILTELQHDHRSLGTVLRVLEHQIALMRDGDADLALVEAVLDYCTSYGDQWHHPTEDLVYAALERDGGTVGNVSRSLHDEHRALGELTETLHDMVEDLLSGGVLPREKVLETAERFLHDYRAHMDFEERFLFPAALSALSEETWSSIETESRRMADPLFGDQVAERFAALREHIHGLEQASVPPPEAPV